MLESQKGLFTFEGTFDVADGYWIAMDFELGMETWFNNIVCALGSLCYLWFS
jgi:hypothetical protein